MICIPLRKTVLSFALILLTPATVMAQSPLYGAAIPLRQAKAVVALAQEEAVKRGLTMAFAVAQPSGEPILLEVTDGTQNASITIAPAKARTAARFRKSTRVLQNLVASGNLSYAHVDGAVALDGGEPIVVAGRIVGALGVSGGTFAQDGEVARAALDRFANR